MKRSLHITEDGSHTVHCHDTGESFHSDQGSVMESMHVFIDNGLKKISASIPEIRILEIGFGTGLNALLTYQESKTKNQNIFFETLELYPLEKNIYDDLNFISKINLDQENILNDLHHVDWGRENVFENFKFVKHHISLVDFYSDHKYHVIYFDAFSPDKQPELWTLGVFQKIYEMMEEGGILVTYCAKGIVKRALRSAGFQVEKLNGAGRKRHMIRAEKN